ncbi:hypothetical protein A2U01_0063734, partial [Trifolium medium]|nr:hypothetical protein [Trifolium medium]
PTTGGVTPAPASAS